jgi:hypothetical protein
MFDERSICRDTTGCGCGSVAVAVESHLMLDVASPLMLDG